MINNFKKVAHQFDYFWISILLWILASLKCINAQNSLISPVLERAQQQGEEIVWNRLHNASYGRIFSEFINIFSYPLNNGKVRFKDPKFHVCSYEVLNPAEPGNFGDNLSKYIVRRVLENHFQVDVPVMNVAHKKVAITQPQVVFLHWEH